MNKACKEHVAALTRIAAQFGATVQDAHKTGHVKLQVLLKDGRTITHSVCATPSDHRSRLNDQCDLKRRLRELSANG